MFRFLERASHGSLSSAPSRNLLNMMPDLQGYKATRDGEMKSAKIGIHNGTGG
jgi:hypothetical protein